MRKEPLGERLIDHDNGLASFHGAAVDDPAADDPHAHRLEVAAGNRAEHREWRNGARRNRPPFHAQRITEASTGERQAG